MVIQTVKPESTYVNGASVSTAKSNSSVPMSVQMDKLTDYLHSLDGTPSAIQRFEPLFRVAFHSDFVLESPGGNLTYDGLLSLVRSYAERGARAKVLKRVDNGDGTATLTIENKIPGETEGDVTQQRVWFRDGKAVKVVAVEADAAQFGALIQRLRVPTVDDIAEKHQRFLGCFNGSPDAYAKAEPFIDELFSPNLVIENETDVKMDIDGFKEWASSYSEERNVVTVEKLEKMESGIRVWVRNVVGGVDLGVSQQVGSIENGKIVYWKAVPQDKTAFNKMVSTVAANSKGTMMGNIQRLRDYLAALDGTANAWEKFQPHIDRVLARDIVWEDSDGGSRLDYDGVVDLLKNQYIPNGCYPVLESVEDKGNGVLVVVINNHLPGEKGDATRQTLYYGSDDLIHKLVSTEFASTYKRIAALPKTVA